MAFPSKLKQTMMFNDGEAFIGETVSITPPKHGVIAGAILRR